LHLFIIVAWLLPAMAASASGQRPNHMSTQAPKVQIAPDNGDNGLTEIERLRPNRISLSLF